MTHSVHDYLPNAFELVPNLGTLDRALVDRADRKGYKYTHRSSEQLPFYLRGACESFERLLQLREIAGNEYGRMNLAGNARWLLTGDLSDSMAFAVEACLMYLRRSADAVLLYVSRCPTALGLASSMSDVAKNFAKGKTNQCDDEVVRLTLEYWDRWGNRVKGYRDQASHFAIGVSNCLMFRHPPTAGIGLRLLLPDDPFTKSPSAMTYRPGVPTVAFLNSALYETVKYVNCTIERLIDLTYPDEPEARERQTIVLGLRGGDPLAFDEDVTYGEPVPHTVDARTIVERATAEVFGDR